MSRRNYFPVELTKQPLLEFHDNVFEVYTILKHARVPNMYALTVTSRTSLLLREIQRESRCLLHLNDDLLEAEYNFKAEQGPFIFMVYGRIAAAPWSSLVHQRVATYEQLLAKYGVTQDL